MDGVSSHLSIAVPRAGKCHLLEYCKLHHINLDAFIVSGSSQERPGTLIEVNPIKIVLLHE